MDKQTFIIQQLKVAAKIQPENEIARRKAFIKAQLKQSGFKHLILGISGGVDSATLGMLSQHAVNELNQQGESFKFVAMRLPYLNQADEADANIVMDFINPDIKLEVNIQSGTDAIHDSVTHALQHQDLLQHSAQQMDYVKGNVKARMRMIAQYEVAAILGGLVLGTDHSAENITGFFTKWGDGACDLIPLFGLNKRQVRQIASYLQIPQKIIHKPPTADLESLTPGKTDESALGLSYDQIDDFLEGKKLPPEISQKLIDIFNHTQHKRNPIPSIYHQADE